VEACDTREYTLLSEVRRMGRIEFLDYLGRLAGWMNAQVDREGGEEREKEERESESERKRGRF